MLKYRNLHVTGIGPIKDLSISFNDHMNIICGTNGIGKTTILDCIAQTFAFNTFSLKRNSESEVGRIESEILSENKIQKADIKIHSNRPQENADDASMLYKLSNEVLVYKTGRNLEYIDETSIPKDPSLQEFEIAGQTVSGSRYSEIKRWFLNRYLWEKQPDELLEEQKSNLRLAIDVINRMQPDRISFWKIDHETNDILLKSNLGPIVLEQLSSGYLAYILVLLGLIKDIEYRFKKPHIRVSDYEGIIVIDEIDVHLHPTLQSKMYHELKRILPKAQIFTSTHSPHVIQVAEADELIPLVRTEGNGVQVNPLINREYGCKGWTIEEILHDVMEMQDTTSDEFKNKMEAFKNAIQENDVERAKELYACLKKMMHPDNVLGKILSIQI